MVIGGDLGKVKLRTILVVNIVHQALFRIFLDLIRVQADPDEAHDLKDDEHDRAVAHAGKDGQARNVLRNADGEGIRHTAAIADRGCAKHQKRGDHGVKAKRKADRVDQRHEGKELLAACGKAGQHAERKQDHNEQQVFPSGKALDKIFQSDVDRAGVLNDLQRTADDQDEENKACRTGKTLVERFEHVKGLDGVLLHAVIAVGIDRLVAGGLIGNTVKRTGGNDISSDRSNEEKYDQDDHGVDRLDLLLFNGILFFEHDSPSFC